MTKSGKRDCPKTMNGVHTFRDGGCAYCGKPDNRGLRAGHAAAAEVFTKEKYPTDPRIVAARKS